MCKMSLTLFLFLYRSIPHPRGHAHLAALVSHDCKFMKVELIVMIHKYSYFLCYCCFVSQLITSLTESTTCPLEKTFLGSSALWMAQRKSLLIVRLGYPSILFTDLTFLVHLLKLFQTIDRIHFYFLPPANHIFQYFITIVPTKLNTYKVSAETHQYSVTEQVDLL